MNSRLPGLTGIALALAGSIVAGGTVLLFHALWIAPPAVLKHINDIAGPVSPFLTFLAVTVAAIGWYATAWFNGEEARRTERAKQEHARQGTHRQLRTLLRDALRTVNFFYAIVPTGVDQLDSISTRVGKQQFSYTLEHVDIIHRRLSERLTQLETAAALSDEEYDALDAFVANFGGAIARAQRFKANEANGNDSLPLDRDEARNNAYCDSLLLARDHPCRLWLACASCFTIIHPSLKAIVALPLLGDDEMRSHFDTILQNAEQLLPKS
jgi:hypothetical protein